MVRLIKSNRGGSKLVDDLNYLYRLNGKCGEKTYWACDISECRARIHSIMEGNEPIVVKTVGYHHHASQPFKPKSLETKQAIKSLALNSQASSRDIIAQASSNLDDSTLAFLPSAATLSRRIRDWRQKENRAPPIPMGRSGYSIPNEFRTLSNGEEFLLFDSGMEDPNRLLIFGTQDGLKDLETNGNWACDGTFRSSPNIYYQMFTLHVIINNTSIPRIFALLPGKSQNHYEMLFIQLRNLNPRLRPISLMIDFEKAIMNAFTEVFPTSNITGCLFHLAKNIYRHIVDLGMRELYLTNGDFNTKMKSLTALAFLPIEDVISGFYELTNDDTFPQEIVAYFETYYIGGVRGQGEQLRRLQPPFPIKLWNVNQRTIDKMARTNNSVEGFHNAIQSSITCAHPNLWKVIEFLKKEETLAKKKYIDAFRGDITRKTSYNKIDERLHRLVLSYNPSQKI
ncbi:Putative LOC100898192, partial [Caligus rogercresseyi]